MDIKIIIVGLIYYLLVSLVMKKRDKKILNNILKINTVNYILLGHKMDNNTILESKWKMAQTGLEYGIRLFIRCDMCKAIVSSYFTRVFHSIYPNFYTIRYKKLPDGTNKTIYDDHILVCLKCKNKISKHWMSCRCKNKENLCHKQKVHVI